MPGSPVSERSDRGWSEGTKPTSLWSIAMPRHARPIDDGLVYHVINRGNNRAPVFFEDEDYVAFLRTIGDLKARRPFALFGYCLMPNHVHLLVRPLEVPISRIMQSLLVSHTQRYHRRHGSVSQLPVCASV